MIKRDSWRILEAILLRYPEKKREYEEYISDIMGSAEPGSSRQTDMDNRPQSVTEAKALKMTSVYMDRLKKEIGAVESAYNDLKPDEQEVIRARYWRGNRKPVPYLQLKSCYYSERQMKRIVLKIITKIGKNLGEIQ